MYSQRGLLDTNPAMAWMIIIIALALVVVMIASMWKVFTKAGKPGWAAIVPIYNVIVLVQVGQKPGWWAAILLLAGIIPIAGPLVALVFQILLGMAIAEKFGKSQAFGIVALGLFGFVGYPILAFSDAKYDGAAKSNDAILDA